MINSEKETISCWSRIAGDSGLTKEECEKHFYSDQYNKKAQLYSNEDENWYAGYINIYFNLSQNISENKLSIIWNGSDNVILGNVENNDQKSCEKGCLFSSNRIDCSYACRENSDYQYYFKLTDNEGMNKESGEVTLQYNDGNISIDLYTWKIEN